MYLTKGKKRLAAAVREEGGNVREAILQTPRSLQKEGKRCSRCRSRGSSAACGEDHGEAGCPLRPTEAHGGADVHPQPEEDPTPQQVEMPWRKLQPTESRQRSRILAGAVARGEDPMQELVSQQDLWPVGDPHWSSLLLKGRKWRRIECPCSPNAAHWKAAHTDFYPSVNTARCKSCALRYRLTEFVP